MDLTWDWPHGEPETLVTWVVEVRRVTCATGLGNHPLPTAPARAPHALNALVSIRSVGCPTVSTAAAAVMSANMNARVMVSVRSGPPVVRSRTESGCAGWRRERSCGRFLLDALELVGKAGDEQVGSDGEQRWKAPRATSVISAMVRIRTAS